MTKTTLCTAAIAIRRPVREDISFIKELIGSPNSEGRKYVVMSTDTFTPKALVVVNGKTVNVHRNDGRLFTETVHTNGDLSVETLLDMLEQYEF